MCIRDRDYPVLTAANGQSVVVSGHPAENGTFEMYMTAVGRPDLVDDPRFADSGARLTHLDQLEQVLHDWAANMPDADAIETAMAHGRLAVGQLRSLPDAVSYTHLRATRPY